jgi:hypothetical protein
VALFLVGLTLATISFSAGDFSPHRKLEETLDNLERSVRFSIDEAALRNSVVRVHIFIDKEPQEFTVEFGPGDDFVLPRSVLSFGQARGKRAEEKEEKEKADLNKKFSKVPEFKEKSEELPEQVKFIGMGTTLVQTLVNDGEASLFTYPTGEKDAAIIFLATEDEMAILKVEAFTLDFEREFIPLDDGIDGALDQAEGIFKAWLKS